MDSNFRDKNGLFSPQFVYLFYLFIWGFTQHPTGHITMGSWSRFCTVNCRPMASNYQLSHLWRGGGRRECCHSTTVAPTPQFETYTKSTSTFMDIKGVIKDNFWPNFWTPANILYWAVTGTNRVSRPQTISPNSSNHEI